MNNIGTLALEDIAKADLPPKDRIVRAARELFYRSGLHSVGVDAIAEAEERYYAMLDDIQAAA